MSNGMIGVVFTLGSVTYMITSSLIGLLTSYIDRRYIMQIGFTAMILQNLVLGPSSLIRLDDH